MWSETGVSEKGVESSATTVAYVGRGSPGGVDSGGIGIS